MSIIQRLTQENLKLREEKKQVEADMAFVAKTTKDAWDEVGLDFSSMKSPSGGKMSMIEVSKIAMTVGKKMLSGKIKTKELAEKWEVIQPILKKYEHILDENKASNV